MATKVLSLEDIIPQIPFRKILKVYDKWFQYFQLSDKLVISNGHIFFLISLDYLEPVIQYVQNLQTKVEDRQIILSEAWDSKIGASDNYRDIQDFLNLCGFKEETAFDPYYYDLDYLKIVESLTPNNPVLTLKMESPAFVSQASIWQLEDMDIVLAGRWKHNHKNKGFGL